MQYMDRERKTGGDNASKIPKEGSNFKPDESSP